MINKVQLDGEPAICMIDRPEIKLSDTPQIAIAIPCGSKDDNTLIQCPVEQGGCGRKYVMQGTRSPFLVPVRWMLEKDKLVRPLNTVTATMVESGRLSAEARQIMTKKAIRIGCKYVLYWDDDVLVPELGLYTMHNFMEQNPEVGAISAVYTTRENPPEPLVYKQHGKGAWWDFPMGDGAEPQPIFGAGAGFLLARISSIVDVIEKLKQENGGEELPIWADERIEPGVEGQDYPVMCGHDIRFCRLLNKYGHQVYIDGRVLCGHLDVETDTVYRMPNDPKNSKVKFATTKDQPSVDILVVDYNQADLALQTIQAVKANTDYPNYNVILYKNAEMGLAAFWNAIIEDSEADYVCLLNPDTIPAKNWLTKIMRYAAPDVGALVPSSNLVFGSQIETSLDRFETNFETINKFASTLKSGAKYMDTMSGMCLVFPRALWKETGGFDEDFQLYGEDLEFTWRLKNKFGKKLVWVQDAYVHHFKAQCTQKAIAEGKDIDALRKESERLVNEKTDLRISHGVPVEQLMPGSHLRPGWSYQENPFSEDKSKVHRQDSSERLRLLKTYADFTGKKIVDLGGNLGWFGFKLDGYKEYINIDYDLATLERGAALHTQYTPDKPMKFVCMDIIPEHIKEYTDDANVVFAFSVLPWIAKAGVAIDDVLEVIKEKECYIELMYQGDAMSGGVPGVTNDDEAKIYLERHFKYVTCLGADTHWHRRTIWKCSNSLGNIIHKHEEPWSKCTIILTDRGYTGKEFPTKRANFMAHADREYRMLLAAESYKIAPLPVTRTNTYHTSYIIGNNIWMTTIHGDELHNEHIAVGCPRVISALEKMDVRHRDIRPENLIWSEGRLYLLDWEWAVCGDEVLEHPEGLGSIYRVPDFDNQKTFEKVLQLYEVEENETNATATTQVQTGDAAI